MVVDMPAKKRKGLGCMVVFMMKIMMFVPVVVAVGVMCMFVAVVFSVLQNERTDHQKCCNIMLGMKLFLEKERCGKEPKIWSGCKKKLCPCSAELLCSGNIKGDGKTIA